MKKFILSMFFICLFSPAFSLAIQLNFSNLWSTGIWSDSVALSLGGGGGVEYTLPLELENCDCGVQFKAEYLYVIPKQAGTDSFSDISILPGLFVSLPFKLESVNLSLHPELGYGVVLHNAKVDGHKKLYVDQMIYLAMPLRLSFLGLPQLELDAGPVYTFTFEKKSVLTQAGCRAGLVWRF
ncbi:MAG: hypothetical protein J5687_09565 [Treponema sp.]|nr:hypothetical protein [Treponema sp.]